MLRTVATIVLISSSSKGPEPIPQHIAGTPQQKQKSRVPAGILPDLESRSSPALGWVESGDSELDAVPGSGQRRIRPVSGDEAENRRNVETLKALGTSDQWVLREQAETYASDEFSMAKT